MQIHWIKFDLRGFSNDLATAPDESVFRIWHLFPKRLRFPRVTQNRFDRLHPETERLRLRGRAIQWPALPRPDDRIGRGSLFVLDCSQSECVALGVHAPHYTPVSIVGLR